MPTVDLETQAPHPQVADLLAGILRPDPTGGVPTLDGVRYTTQRLSEILVGPGEPVLRTWDSNAQSPHGSVPLRWYESPDAARDSLLVYVHGGGWVAGNRETHDTASRAFALRTRFIVVTVDYTLSPEAPHPQAILEVADVLQHVRSLAREFGLEIRNLAVAGDSAGGHLLGAALHHLAASKSSLPDAAVFVYPITDVSLDYPSYTRFGEGFALTGDRMRWYWEQYLGEDLSQLGERRRDPYISPLYSPHLDRFPPSLIITAGLDVLHDEGEALAERLRQNSVPVEHIDVPGHIHGFLRYRKVLTDPVDGPDAIMVRIGAFLGKHST
jgi:acetyl esterase